MNIDIAVESWSATKDVVVGVSALIGMGLGIFNFWKARQDEKIKLEVIPKAVILSRIDQRGREIQFTSPHRIDGGKLLDLVAIEIINRSKFPVVIATVGFGRGTSESYLLVPEPIMKDGEALPWRLEPRASLEVRALLSPVLHAHHRRDREYAFAVTACNHTASGTSEAMKILVAQNDA